MTDCISKAGIVGTAARTRGAALWLGVAAAALAFACKADTTGLGVLGVEEVSQLIAAGESVALCDANNADTRAKLGVIAGARLLSSYRDYDVATELPTDKSSALVFYCHSEFCSAAAEAGRRAQAAGYRQVFVMPAGIKGWIDAGRAIANTGAL